MCYVKMGLEAKQEIINCFTLIQTSDHGKNQKERMVRKFETLSKRYELTPNVNNNISVKLVRFA